MAGAASFAMKEQAVKAEQIGEAVDIIESRMLLRYTGDGCLRNGYSAGALGGGGRLHGAGRYSAEHFRSVVRFGNASSGLAPLLPVLNQMFLRACLVFLNSCTCGSQAEKGVMEAMDQLNSLCLHHDFLDEERFIRLLAETASG